MINLCREYDEMIADYEALTSDLLEWIKKTIETLNDRQFPNSLTGVQNMLSQFNNYRNLEKPPKFVLLVESDWYFSVFLVVSIDLTLCLKCRKRRLNQGSFVVLYFNLSALSDLYLVFACLFSSTVFVFSYCMFIFLYCFVCQYRPVLLCLSVSVK